jgi:hypothetical protein
MHGSVAKSHLVKSQRDAGGWSYGVVIFAVAAAIYAVAVIATEIDGADVLAPIDRIERDAARLERLHRPRPWLVMARAICCEPAALSERDRSLLFCDRLASAMRHPASDVDAREYPYIDQFPGRRLLWHWRVRREYRVSPREASALCHGLFGAETLLSSPQPSLEPQRDLVAAD